MTVPVLVVNRTVDRARLARFQAAAAAQGVTAERIPALDAHDPLAPLFLYRRHLRDSFWGADQIKPGAFACYLSHAAAWARLVASGAEMALICEDDALFLRPPARLLTAARRLGGFDIIFAGARLCGWRAAVAQARDRKLAPVGEVLDRMTAKGLRPGAEGLARAPGAEAYLLSREGAMALLAGLETDGVIAGVDWAMLWRGRGAATPDWAETAFLSTAAKAPPLRVFVADQPVCAVSGARSVLRHKTRIAIARLRDRPEAQPLSGPDPTLTRLPEGDPRDPVFADFAAGRFHERPALELMRRWMPEGGLFVDIGAHAGGHTLFMLRHGGAGRAIALEFNPMLADPLRAAVAANGLEDRADLTMLGVGLGETRGKRERKGSDRILSNNRLRPGFVETVNIRPGDWLLREERPEFIKIDVNGDEREVLKGLRKTLRRAAPVLGLDLSHRRADKARAFLARHGYREAETATWREGATDRAFAIFTPAP